jgi:hypothetical protein
MLALALSLQLAGLEICTTTKDLVLQDAEHVEP